MLDKDWLDRVTIAYRVYKQSYGENTSIKEFISWLYTQYGITEPKESKE